MVGLTETVFETSCIKKTSKTIITLYQQVQKFLKILDQKLTYSPHFPQKEYNKLSD